MTINNTSLFKSKWGDVLQIFWVLILLLSSLRVNALSLEDLTLLMPFPKSESELRALPSLSSVGGKGVLIPKKYFDELPILSESRPERRNLRVVGIRFDPCFPWLERSGREICQPQIRMVAQHILQNKGAYTTEDLAVHLFYKLKQTELIKLIHKSLELKKKFGVREKKPRSLWVHGGITQFGLTSTYTKQLLNEIQALVGEQNLVRFTFMTVNPFRNQWDFGAFDVRNKNVFALQIPNVFEKTSIQSVARISTSLRAGVLPKAIEGDNANFFINRMNVTESNFHIRRSRVREELKMIARIENPEMNNPNTVDCFSCHASESARRWSVNKFRSNIDVNKYTFFPSSDVYQGRRNRVTENLTNFRAFGYFFDQPSIMQRTVNETILIQEKLLTIFFK